VEQKELGKLEASSKQERIKAMSSLLNLEAFIDSRDKLKKEGSDLEKTHLQTLRKLDDAEKAKEEYEKADTQLNEAEKRLTKIAQEKVQVHERLEQLQKDLAIIQQMKTHQTKINETRNSIQAKSKELELLQGQLAEVEKAEQELEQVKTKIPEAEKQLAELEEKQEAVQTLSGLLEQLRDAESSLETINVRYTESERAHIEATEAQQRITELEEKIKEYTPVRSASQLLNELSNQFNRLTTLISDKNRQEKELNEAQMRLGDSQSSAETIKQLEDEESQIKSEQKNAQKMRNYGFGVVIAGLVLAIAFAYMFDITAAIVVGILGLAVGGFFYVSNDPSKLDSKLDALRNQREDTLGERARLQDYQESIENLEKQHNESQENLSQLQETIIETLNRLPDQPREYKTTISITEKETLDTLRAQIQEDSETLTRYTTEKSSLQEKADSLETVENTLEAIKQEQETKNTTLEDLGNQIKKTEEETGITRDQETEIRKQYDTANRTLTQLTTQQTNYQQALERRPQIQENITEANNEINLLNAVQQQEEKKLKELESSGINLGDEPELTEENIKHLKRSAALENEEHERNNDVTEAKSVIEETSELREKYPALLEESDREKFTIESIRRAVNLLDITREGIMAGVKQDVEKNMMQFLPTLTDNRYNRAQIDEANYRIEVYDREAKTWRGKGVFSGATQDQFSLALRLAFAISTIPNSRGARPGFIFLDEPLSGFDAQRRTGFIELLRDDLSRHFDQIIVISHIEALAEEFPQNLTLDQGRIVQQ
jgi:exonuclease SbcC